MDLRFADHTIGGQRLPDQVFQVFHHLFQLFIVNTSPIFPVFFQGPNPHLHFVEALLEACDYSRKRGEEIAIVIFELGNSTTLCVVWCP